MARKAPDIDPKTGKPYPPGKHPNSIKAFDENRYSAPAWDKGGAQLAQKRSVEARKRNKAAREKLKLSVEEIKAYNDTVNREDLPALDILRALMLRAMSNEDLELAADLALKIAEYETPKKQRIETINREVETDQLSDDELDKLLNEAVNVRKIK